MSKQLDINGPAVIVDDEEDFRKMMGEMLAELDIESIQQDSGAHCVRFMQNQPWNWYPAIVFTDIVMDGMGGYQLIRRIQELYPRRNIPVVVVSKLDAAVDVGEAEIAGAAAYLTKPISKKRLQETLERIFSAERKGMIVFSSDYGRRNLRSRLKDGKE